MTEQTLDVNAFILSCLRQQLAAIGMADRPLPDDFDLRATGVIDSLGFIQLMTEIERRVGCAIDLSGLPPEQLTDLGVLSRHIAVQIPVSAKGQALGSTAAG